MINRSSPPCGYWDDPVKQISASGTHLQFVRFFDWDELDRRDFRYLEVDIAEFAKQPRLVGRRALVNWEYVRVVLVKP